VEHHVFAHFTYSDWSVSVFILCFTYGWAGYIRIILHSVKGVRGQLNIYFQQTLPKDRPGGSKPDDGEISLRSAVHQGYLAAHQQWCQQEEG